MKNLVIKSAIAAISLTSFVSAFAASQGELGGSSSGEVGLSATVQPMVKVSGLDDMTFDISNHGQATKSENLCVYSNTDGSYSVTVSSANQSFSAASDYGSLDYSVKWGDKDLSHNAPLSVQNGAHTTNQNCSDGEVAGTNATLTVTFSPEDIASAHAGVYSDALTIMVEPSTGQA